MTFHYYGNKEHPSFFLLHGTGCHWENSFSQVINLLKERYYLVCVAMSGHDDKTEDEFISMSHEVELLEKEIKNVHKGKIDGIYGSSLGGSLVAKLLE